MPRGLTRALAVLVTASVLSTVIGVVVPTAAYAAGTLLFQNSFANRTVDGTGTVTVPTPPNGQNVVCLTASGNSATPPVLSCAGASDAQGSGKLRLTNSTTSQVGGVFGQSSFPTSSGLDVSFTSYQWGGAGSGADGLGFMLAAVDPANPVAPASIGASGGALGYSASPGVNGLTNAYLGVGLDVFGNFSSTQYSGTGCAGVPNISVRVPGAVVVRGPGSARVGYCGLTTTYNGTAGSQLPLRAATRAASAVPVQVLINPTGASFTSDSGVSVAAGTYKVVVTPVGQAAKTLSGALPTVAAGLYPSASWLSAGGVPKQLAFGFVGSTGSVTDSHEISATRVLTFNPVPQLGISGTSFSAATSQPGDPVTYKLTPSVLAGANVASPISATQTTPAGVVPVGAYGTGWVCQAPAGPSVTCTTSASSFANGTTLPDITVVAIVTGTGVTSDQVRIGSTSTASSADASPATDSVMTAGTVPGAPTGVAANPASGPVAGGGLVYVTASTDNLPPSAVEIGTAAEQQAGTPVVLLPCTSGRAAGCFNVEGSTMVILSMPARSDAAAVTITVVTLGVATATSYVYAGAPAIPATPTATAGITSATVSWVAPAANGSPITGYLVTPYLAGAAQAPQSFDATATTRTLTGLTAGGSYTFTVAAVNAYGTSAASGRSAAVVPYALPNAPTITAVTAGTAAATLTWTAPGNGGSAITGYLVTPFIGTVAQPAQVFAGTATTQTVTGLTAGTVYTFTVAAQNLAGTGPASAKSGSVTPNVSPSLDFAAPPNGEVGVAYSRQLTVSGGTSPFAWSTSSGSLPAGLALNASTGLLSGTPTAAGTFPVTVRVTDGSGQVATRTVTIVIAVAPTLTFAPAAGEVGVPYSQQPGLTGGTAPFAWTVNAGSLPPGLTLDPSTGLVGGTPTAAGTFTLTIAATDAFNQVAARTVSVLIVARPAFTAAAPPSGQVGVAYCTSFDVTGGALPLTWSITAGTPPPGLTFTTGTGGLSGTPTTTGSSAFTVSVTDANNQTATKTVTLVITAGPLTIVKTANVSTAATGSVVAYTITVGNTGSTAFTGVALNDPLTGVLDDATYNGNGTASTGTVTYTAPNLGWTGNIAAGASVTIGYSVTVNDPDTGNKVLSNTVTSTTLGTNCGSASTDTRCTAAVTVAGLTIVKTADVATTTPGSRVRFTVVVTNTGQTPYPAATFTDTLADVLDDASYNADAATTSGNVSYSGPVLTWTGALAVGGSATITYSVTVAPPNSGNRSLTGTVVSPSAGSPCPSGNPAAQCTATVTVLVPALSITNTASPATTTPGGRVSYTLTLSNTGQTPYTGITVTDAFADVVDDADYNNDAAASSGSVALDGGSLALIWTGTIAVGATVTITGSATVRSPDPANKVLVAVATSSAPGSSCPTGSTNPACTSTVRVLVPALTLATSANVSTTTPGSVVSYTVSATNSGQTPYSGATFSVALAGVLDDATYDTDATTTSGAVSVTGSTLTWTGDLLVAASATITYSVTTKSPATGDRTLAAVLTSTTAGSTCPAGGGAPACSSSVTVLIPGLRITNTADTATTTPGSVVRYVGTVENTGATTYTDITVTVSVDDLSDDATYNNDALVTTGTQTVNPDGTVSWSLSLAPGAIARSTISATVNDPVTGNGTLVTSATSTAPGSTCPTATPAGCSTSVSVLVPGLTITASASTSTVVTGGQVGYTITVANVGQTTYPAASFTDDLTRVLTDATYGGGATATTGTVSSTGSVLSWTGALAPGASATITYSVTVRDPDPGDKQLINTVVSTAARNNCAAGSADTRCTVRVNVLEPRLTIAKTASVATTAPGATVGYSILVTNSGTTAFAGASFTDALAGVLDDAVSTNDAVATSGTVGYAGSTLTWTGDLAVGATATITYSVTVRAADVGDDLLTSAVASTTSGTNCVAGGTDPRCTVTVPVARLTLAYGATDPTITPGGTVFFSSTYANTGQVPYVGISVAILGDEAADDGLPGGDLMASSGTLVVGETGATWTGSIPVGGIVTLSATMGVKNPDPGNKIIVVTLESAAPGNNCAAGSADARCTVHITVLVPALTITKTADTTSTQPGGTVGYTITAHNTGQTAYTGATLSDPLNGVLGNATYDGDVTATSGTATVSSSTLTWTGDLGVGATATITYSVTVIGTPTGDLGLFNAVSSGEVGSTCPPSSGNTACRSSVDILVPSLAFEKTADRANVPLGTAVTYTVTATNTGQTTYPAATFTDPLAGVLDDATYDPAATTASSGTTGYSDGVLTWTGALTPGSAATVTYTVTTGNPAAGDLDMANTIASTSTGSNCATGSTDPRCTATVAITNAAGLTFTKTADTATTVPGGVVAYTVTVTNSTDSAVDADLTDPLGAVLDDATYNANAVASGGTVSYSAPDLAWTGPVPAHGTVTITYSVTVHAAITGDQILTGSVRSTSLATSNNCIAGSTDPRCVSTVPVARLQLAQTAAAPTATPGSIVSLTATYTNTGKVPYNGISVASPRADTSDDTIPTGDQTATTGTLVRTATAITWTGDIPVGATVTVLRTLAVRDPDPGNKLITATLVSTAAGTNCPSGTTDPTCTFLVTVLVPALTITKTANTPYTVPGGSVGYTITAQNTGEAPYAAASFTDLLAGVLDDAAYDGNATTSIGTVTATASTLTWTGDLAVNATATISYSVTALNPGTGDKTMVNAVASTTVGNTCPPGSPTAACRSTIAVLTPALTLTSAAGSATTVPGATVTYTVTATNSGQTPYPAAAFQVPLGGVLDDATYGGDATAGTGTVGYTGGTLSWTGTLYPGAAVTLTYSVTVNQPVGGNFRLDQTVVSADQGSTCPAAGTDARCTTSVPVASLRIVNTTDVSTAQPTSVVASTVTITNTGQVPYVDISLDASFSGSLDDTTYNGDAGTTSGSLLLLPTGVLRWTGSLPVGATATLTGSVTVNNPDLGDRVLTSFVTTAAAAGNCPAGGTDPLCSTRVTVLIPALTVSKTVDTTTATPGSTVGYTLTATNTGQTPYTGATLQDSLTGLLDDATYDADAVASTGLLGSDASTLTWTGDLASGQSVVITYSVHVGDPDLGDRIMVNDVESGTLGSSCPTGGSTPACSTTVTVLIPALETAVTADATTTVPGATVGYTVTVHNTGQTAYSTATVTVPLAGVLDDATYDADAVASSGLVSFGSPTLTWTGGLAVGATVTITYTVKVADPDRGDLLLSTAVSSDTPGSACGAGLRCANTVTVLIPGLAVSTTADVATATPGDRVAFTVTVTNTGQTPYTGTVSTALGDVVDDATFDGLVVASTGVATYAAPGLSWTGSLPVGATATIGYAVTVRSPDPGNRVLTTTVLARSPGSTCGDGSTNPACTATVTVLVPGLDIRKSASTPTTTPGSVVGYTIVVTNTGQTAYDGAVVTDSLTGVLPDADYDADAAVAGGGTLAYAGSTLTWTGDLAVGAVASITYSITVHDPDTGDKALVNTAFSAAPGSTCPPGNALPACSTLVRVLVPALTMTKAADTSTVVAGGAVSYTVTLVNTGETPYAPARFTDSLVDVLDDADYAGDAAASTGTVEYTNSTLVWTGALGIGATATVSYSVTARHPATGDLLLANTVTSTSPGATCRAGTTDGSCRAAVTVLVPALTITKTADAAQVVATGSVGYTIQATNTGQADYPAATLTDSMAGVLDDGAVYDADATATSGAVGYTDGALTWTGALPRGATVVIGYSVTTAAGGTGDGVLTNRVTSTTTGSSCAPAGAGPGCATATTIVARTFALTDLTQSFTVTGTPGSTVTTDGVPTMTVTANNPGGYRVTVRSATALLVGAAPGNTMTIPVDRLSVRESGTSEFRALSVDTPLVVHEQRSPSAPGGDAISNDFQVRIPFVASDTYTVTLVYAVTPAESTSP